jgi:hypothetical protein
MVEFMDELTQMRTDCIQNVPQASRGAERLRGFISEDLYRLFKMSVENWGDLLCFARHNGMDMDAFRSAPPTSAINETWHALLRAVSKHVLIADVARRSGQIMGAALIVSDLARTWVWRGGVGGAQSSYPTAHAQSPEQREEAMAAYLRGEQRAYEIKTSARRRREARQAAAAGTREATRSAPTTAAELTKMQGFVELTNTRQQQFKLTFRDGVAKGNGSSMFASNSARRSLLWQSVVNPSKLLKDGSKGLPRAFDVSRVTVIDYDDAVRQTAIASQLVEDSKTVLVIRPKPKDNTIELDLMIQGEATQTLATSILSVRSAIMELVDGARPGNPNGVVNITFMIARKSRFQLLSMNLKKKDQNTIRMLVNLHKLKDQFLWSALVQGGEPRVPSRLLLAARRRVLELEDTCAAGPPMFGTVWRTISTHTALSEMRGIIRISALPGLPVIEPLTQLLQPLPAATVGSFLYSKPIKPKASARALSSVATGDDGMRHVKPYLEEEDISASNKRSNQNYHWLVTKWVGLHVYDKEEDDNACADNEGGDSDSETKGTIVDFAWDKTVTKDDKGKSVAAYVAQVKVVDDDDDEPDVYLVGSLPGLVRDAELYYPQSDVCVEYDHDEPAGDAERALSAQLVAEEDETEDEIDEVNPDDGDGLGSGAGAASGTLPSTESGEQDGGANGDVLMMEPIESQEADRRNTVGPEGFAPQPKRPRRACAAGAASGTCGGARSGP